VDGTDRGRVHAELVKGVIGRLAFAAQDLPAAIARLKARGIASELRKLPLCGIWQLFFFDPNGAKVALDSDLSEQEPAA
jgi:hypothetical protein